jgi:CubicO group peptidase (beta-lactamase class C family)
MRHVICLLVCVLTAMSPAIGQDAPMTDSAPPDGSVVLPDTPAGRQLGAFLTVFDRGDRDAIAAFMTEHFVPVRPDMPGPAERSLVFAKRREIYGRVTLDAIELDEATRLRAIGHAERADVIEAEVIVEPGEPHRIVSLDIRRRRPPDAPAHGVKLESEQIVEQAGRMMDALDEQGRFSGVVMIAKDGNVIFERATGLASMRFGSANTIETTFNAGALSRMFTGVAVAKLVEEGKLDYADTVGKYLPDYPDDVVTSIVTIEQLLTHTAGLDDLAPGLVEQHASQLRTIDDWMSLLDGVEVAWYPGQEFHYTAPPYIILGAIIEKASGESYYEYVQHAVFDPAGMVHTGFFDLDVPIEGVAEGYTRRHPRHPDRLVSNRSLVPVHGGPAGPVFTTARDLLRFAGALQRNELLGQESTRLVLDGKALLRGTQYYGYGFFHSKDAVPVVGHAGTYPGANAQFDMYPTEGYVVVVLANIDPPIAQLVASQINRWIVGR